MHIHADPNNKVLAAVRKVELNGDQGQKRELYLPSQVAFNILRCHQYLRSICHRLALEWNAELRHVLLDKEKKDGQHRPAPGVQQQPSLHFLGLAKDNMLLLLAVNSHRLWLWAVSSGVQWGKCSFREKTDWHAALTGTVAIISKIHFNAVCCFVAQMGPSLFCISLSQLVLRDACCDLLSTERKDRLGEIQVWLQNCELQIQHDPTTTKP